MKKGRKIGRYLLIFLLLFIAIKIGIGKISKRDYEMGIPPIEERLLKKFPLIEAELIDLKGETLFLKGGRKVLISRRHLFEKFAVLDSLLRRGEPFKVCDLRYDGIAILRREEN